MNEAQRLWSTQAQADHGIFIQLRGQDAAECHLLHYLQMATEKLSKAYFWRSGHPPPRSHIGFVRFLKALLSRRTDLDRIAGTLGFRRPEDLRDWVRTVQPLAYDLQNIVPDLAQNGPNPEYPWPHEEPARCPAEFHFPLWRELRDTGKGRKLIDFVHRSITRFDAFA